MPLNDEQNELLKELYNLGNKIEHGKFKKKKERELDCRNDEKSKCKGFCDQCDDEYCPATNFFSEVGA